jgi:hypothetical protein
VRQALEPKFRQEMLKLIIEDKLTASRDMSSEIGSQINIDSQALV